MFFFKKSHKNEKVKKFAIEKIQNLESGTEFTVAQLLPQDLSFDEKEKLSKEIIESVRHLVDFKTGNYSWQKQPLLKN